MAPLFCASSSAITCACAAALARISALTMASTLAVCSARHGCVVGEVEAGAFGIDQRTLLLHMGAQHLAQGLVHQVGGAVVAHGLGAGLGVDLGDELVAHLDRAFEHAAVVAEHIGLDLQACLRRRSGCCCCGTRRSRQPGRRSRRRRACGPARRRRRRRTSLHRRTRHRHRRRSLCSSRRPGARSHGRPWPRPCIRGRRPS